MTKCMLTDRITIQRLNSTITNENDFEIENWGDYYTCWSSKRDVSGKEFMQLGGDKTLLVTSFTTRYCNLLKYIVENQDTKNFRIIHKGHIYDIQYIYDVKNEHNFIDFKCRRVS